MPVINSYINQLKSILKGEITTEELIEKIPYLGLDLEEVNSEYFTIEYNVHIIFLLYLMSLFIFISI